MLSPAKPVDSGTDLLPQAKTIVEQAGFNPYRIPYNNKDYLDLASNNYLGLAEHPAVKAAVCAAVAAQGVSLCGTPVASGHSEMAEALAKRLAAFTGLETALLFPSCYQANNGIFSALCRKNDLILIDRAAHSSLIEGSRMAGCRINPFLHNDAEHLEKVLRRANRSGNYRQIFVVTESVFSTEGSIAPLSDIDFLCRKYSALPLVDDSHGIGVIGASGRGVLEHFNMLQNFGGIYTASLGKSLANMGGMAAGCSEIMETVEYLCPHLVYSTALTPPVLGGISGALDVIEAEFSELAKRMWNYREIIASAIASEPDTLASTDPAASPITKENTGGTPSSEIFAAGKSVIAGDRRSSSVIDGSTEQRIAAGSVRNSVPARAPINSIFCGDAHKAIDLCRRLYEKKILSTPFIEPSVPAGRCVVRLIAGAGLKEKEVAWAAEQIQTIISS